MTKTQVQVIAQYMAEVEAVAEAIENQGYVIPEMLEWALNVKDLDSTSMDELASVLVSYDSTGWLGNDFDSRIVCAESAEEIAITTVQEGGIPSLYNLMSGLEGYCDEYVVYNDLEHFKTLTWDYCLDRLEEVLSCIVSDHLEDLKDEYEVIL